MMSEAPYAGRGEQEVISWKGVPGCTDRCNSRDGCSEDCACVLCEAERFYRKELEK